MLAFALQFQKAGGQLLMWTMIKNLLTFRAAQGTSRMVARTLGFGRLATIAGLVGGVVALRKHRATGRA
jgi:hypothetical protein